MRRRPLLRRDERGAVSVDLVGLLPIFLVLAAIIVQSVAVVSAIDATNQAARDAARAQSLGDSAHGAARAALPDWVRLNGVRSGGCADVCMEVEAGVPIGWPGVMTITHVPVTRDAVFVRHD